MEEQLEQRIGILKECGFVDEAGRQDLLTIVKILQEYGIPATDDVMGVIVTHVAAALKRIAEGEAVEALPAEAVQDAKELDCYPKAKEIQEKILGAVHSPLPPDEQDFVLVHVGAILVTAG